MRVKESVVLTVGLSFNWNSPSRLTAAYVDYDSKEDFGKASAAENEHAIVGQRPTLRSLPRALPNSLSRKWGVGGCAAAGAGSRDSCGRLIGSVGTMGGAGKRDITRKGSPRAHHPPGALRLQWKLDAR